jgi:TonB family protein
MPVSRAFFRSLAVLAFAGCLAAPAFADINAFNAAVTRGDYKTAAAEAETIWKTWDTADSQTALVAREFGYAAYVSGRYDLAKQFGQFLVDKGATLATPDKEPATSRVLLRAAEFSLSDGDAQAKALREALQARGRENGVDMTSVLGWERLYRSSWAKGAWGDAERDATAAAELLKRAPSLLVRQRTAEVLKSTAAFMVERLGDSTQRNRAYFIMADTHDAIVGDINLFTDHAVRQQLWSLKWATEAWAYAMESYLDSSDRQVGSNISTKLKPRDLVQASVVQHPEEEATRSIPVCDGAFQGKKVTYPPSKAFKGQVGSVIARMETDATGKVVNVEVLAAVPAEAFADGVVAALKTWTYKPSKKSAGASCRLNYLNHAYKVRFYING